MAWLKVCGCFAEAAARLVGWFSELMDRDCQASTLGGFWPQFESTSFSLEMAPVSHGEGEAAG